ncbi:MULTISPECIES: tyrosine-type recombinase/integrase [Halolamina]|uniref:Site-specific recombinase XerD n=1 Tax=Halolamina pelagica TaxID=699431 RepID=A0A1I5TD14_9EURY|nr:MULTISPECIES: tyrosine-type recombinase/integrase [Halolamina]NHX37284.1 site-specific integrase [Halolamina sp. R1-12]SFP80868.1 Site-specific recombinase XerD [Halolamina pelagica]
MEDAVEQYLDSISRTFTEATVRSHKTTLQAFRQYCENHGLTEEKLTPEQAAKFHLTTADSKASSTVQGEIAILGRFLSGAWNTTPEIATAQIKTAVKREGTNGDHDSNQGPNLAVVQNPNYDHKQVEEFITRLRRCEFGNRAHVLVELLLETHGRIYQIQQLNLNDLDRVAGTIALKLRGTPSSQTDTRTENLSEETLTALSTYIDHERDPIDSTPEPLLTTHAGRATTDTLRRSIKRASKSHGQDSIVTPIDIRRFALSRE